MYPAYPVLCKTENVAFQYCRNVLPKLQVCVARDQLWLMTLLAVCLNVARSEITAQCCEHGQVM